MKKITALIGAGHMGRAIAESALSRGYLVPDEFIIADLNPQALAAFEEMGCRVCGDAAAAASEAHIIILAVKPQSLPALAPKLAAISAGKLFISIAAGVKVETLKAYLPGASVIRVMPNAPLVVGEGMSALCVEDDIDPEEAEFAEGIFACAGATIRIREEQMNALTALTSSAVAYFARIIGVMCTWARENGFEDMSETELYKMICSAASGTADVIRKKDMNPWDLVRDVTSPAGTTEAAMKIFDKSGSDKTMYDALTACKNRGDELAEMK